MPTTSRNTVADAACLPFPRGSDSYAPTVPITPDPGPHGSLRPGFEYLRVSQVRKGRKLRSTNQQADANDENAKRLRVGILHSYRDDNRSASIYKSRRREDYDRLLRDIESGVLDGHLMFIWEISRGSRDVGEWDTLIKLCAAHRIFIYVTNDDDEYDPRKTSDRKHLLDAAVDADAEAGRTRDRVLRDINSSAAAGRPHSWVPYGYERIYDPYTRELVEQREHPAQAEVVRRMFKHVAHGGTIRDITIQLNDEGVPASMGGRWHVTTVLQLLRRPTYIGMRSHVVGRNGPAKLVEGTWAGLVDEDTYWTVQRILDDPARQKVKPGKLKYWLSGFLLCGHCGSNMRVLVRTDKPYAKQKRDLYTCRGVKPCASIDKEKTEDFVEDVVLAHLGQAANRERILASGAQDDAAQVALGAEVERLRAKLMEVRLRATKDEGQEGYLSLETLAVMEPVLTGQIRAAEAKVADAAMSGPARHLIAGGPAKELAARWEAMGPAARRDAIAELIEVKAFKRVAGRSAVHDRIEIRWLR